MKSLKSVFTANYKMFVRDRAALFFSFIFPIMFILIFGWAFSDPGIETFEIGLVVNDGSDQSAAFIEEGLNHVIIDEDEVLDVEQMEAEFAMSELKDGSIDAVIVIPENMDSDVNAREETSLELHYDPSQTYKQQMLIPILNEVINQVDRGMQSSPRIIGMEEHSIQSKELRYIDYLVPGILGMSLMFTGIFGGVPVIQQRQAGIIRRLGCTPLRRSMLVFGELSFRMIIVILTAFIIIVVGRLIFDVQMVGNWFFLCGIVILGTLVFSCIGYLIAAFVKTEEGAIPIINAITFPMMFLSGTFFEVSNMPDFIDPLVKMMPLTYVSDALRQIMVDGIPQHSMTVDIAVMAGWTVVCLAVIIRFFRWD